MTRTHGLRAKLSRPLDFLVISDHAEMYALMPRLLGGDREVLSTEAGRSWYEALTAGDPQLAFATAMEIVASLSDDAPPIDSPKAIRHAWEAYTALADRYNEPGTFTALIGYEYTTEGANNLHRNVIFRDDAIRANQTRPFTQYDSKNPEGLWAFLTEYEERTRREVMAIPHNGNLSNGRMFSTESYDGGPLTLEIAAARARFEPLHEATQIKGDGEGETQERVYGVVWGGDREPGPDGRLPEVGNTVDVASARWTNTIGASELLSVWRIRTSTRRSPRSTMPV